VHLIRWRIEHSTFLSGKKKQRQHLTFLSPPPNQSTDLLLPPPTRSVDGHTASAASTSAAVATVTSAVSTFSASTDHHIATSHLHQWRRFMLFSLPQPLLTSDIQLLHSLPRRSLRHTLWLLLFSLPSVDSSHLSFGGRVSPGLLLCSLHLFFLQA
jgi:hypothetical protein